MRFCFFALVFGIRGRASSAASLLYSHYELIGKVDQGSCINHYYRSTFKTHWTNIQLETPNQAERLYYDIDAIVLLNVAHIKFETESFLLSQY